MFSLSADVPTDSSSIYLVGFPRGDRTASPGDPISPEDWVNIVPHVVPEARVFHFAIFPHEALPTGQDVDDVRDSSKVQSSTISIASAHGSAGLGHQVPATNAPATRSFSAKGLEREAYLLLDTILQNSSENAKVDTSIIESTCRAGFVELTG